MSLGVLIQCNPNYYRRVEGVDWGNLSGSGACCLRPRSLWAKLDLRGSVAVGTRDKWPVGGEGFLLREDAINASYCGSRRRCNGALGAAVGSVQRC